MHSTSTTGHGAVYHSAPRGDMRKFAEITGVPGQGWSAQHRDPVDAVAEFGNGDLASIISTGDTATASGNTDIASVLGDDSSVTAGGPGNYDLAAVFGDMLHAVASGGNGLVDILPSL